MACSSGANDTTNPKTRLTTLPEEIVSNVACRLESDDLFNLRVTCRDIEAKVLHEFATQFITTKCFIFSTASLNTLSSIAGSTKLRQYLRHVFLLTGHFPKPDDGCPALSTRQSLAYAAYATDQHALRQDQDRDMKLLVQAFKQLPSLRTLMIVDHARLLPEGFQWHGLNTFRRKTGYHNISTCPPPDDLYGGFSQEAIETYYEWLAHVFSTMIRSVAESGIATLTKIGTKSVSRSSQYALSPLDMNFSNATITKLTNGLSNLEEMKLQLRTLSLEQASAGDITRTKRRVANFAQACHKVTKLDISFDGSSTSGDFCATILEGMQLSRLTSLQLQSVSVGCSTLAKAVCSLTSARDVTFDGLDLSDGSWVSILKALDKLPLLEHLHIFYASSAGQKTYFLEQEEQPDPASMTDPMSLFGGPPPGDANDGSGQWEETDGDSDEDDEEPPELLALDDQIEEEPHEPDTGGDDSSSSVMAEPSLTADEQPVLTRCKFYHPQWKIPCGHSTERGYFICLQDDEVHAQIPKMIKEHNVAGEGPLNDFFGMLGVGGANGLGGGLLGAMPVAVPVAAPAPGTAANPIAALPGATQALQQALNQIGGMFQGVGPGVASTNGATPTNGAPFNPQASQVPFGANAPPPNGSASDVVHQGAGGGAAQGQNLASATTATQEEEDWVEEVEHGSFDDVD